MGTGEGEEGNTIQFLGANRQNQVNFTQIPISRNFIRILIKSKLWCYSQLRDFTNVGIIAWDAHMAAPIFTDKIT